MKKIALFIVLCVNVVACGSSNGPYTWGDLSLEISQNYCGALHQCGFARSERDYEVCVEHTTFHLCEPDSSCDIEIDEDEARVAMDNCSAVLHTLTYDSEECFFLGRYGFLPTECSTLFDLRPDTSAET